MICLNHVDVTEGVRRCSRCGNPFCPDCLVTIQGRPFCATCKTEQLLDVRSGVDRTRLVYAGFWSRLGAQVLDGLIVGIPAYAIFFAVFSVALNAMQRQATPPNALLLLAAYVPFYLFPILYEALMLTLKDGQTVGKMALRLRVVRPDGSRISAAQAWGRAVMRLVLGCLVVVDVIPYFFTDEKTTLHDIVAGTRVVESP